MDKRIKQWTEIEELVKKAKQGDNKALKLILVQFEPLVHKVSSIIHHQYTEVIPLEEILSNAKCIAVRLILMEYAPQGHKKFKAHFPYLLKKQLHARLVQQFRPTARYRYRTTEIKNEITSGGENPYDMACKKERAVITKHIMRYVNENLSDREKSIIVSHMCYGVPRNALATEYGISYTRLKHIYNRCLKKIKKHLKSIGVTKESI